MKMRIILTAAFCLLLGAALAVTAQEKTKSFAGDWELDTGKSVLSERMPIESMTMKVSQTETQLTVERTTKRTERPEGAGGGIGGGRGMGRGGMGGGMRGGMGGGDGIMTYTLDGKETPMSAPGGMGEMKTRAELEKSGKLKIVQTRELETQMGAMSIKTTETWELLNDGQTLKVKRDMETPRGTQTSEMYFTKK